MFYLQLQNDFFAESLNFLNILDHKQWGFKSCKSIVSKFAQFVSNVNVGSIDYMRITSDSPFSSLLFLLLPELNHCVVKSETTQF